MIYCYDQLISIHKSLSRIYMIDKWFLRQISCESAIIAASHPWLQAYKWCISG